MRDGQLLEKSEIDKIRHIPAVIVQGRYDGACDLICKSDTDWFLIFYNCVTFPVVCPATTAWALHKAWPEAEFRGPSEISILIVLLILTSSFYSFKIIPDAGHSAKENGTEYELVKAAQKFESLWVGGCWSPNYKS